jgi:hypothetical protein
MQASNKQLFAERARKDFQPRLVAAFWLLVIAVSMIGWLVALAWIAYLAIRRLVS